LQVEEAIVVAAKRLVKVRSSRLCFFYRPVYVSFRLFGMKDALAFSVEHDVLQEAIGVVIVPHQGRPRVDLRQLHDLLKYVWSICAMSLADDEQRSSTSITMAFRNCLHGRYSEE
jgi:hypothetical protein